MNKYIEKIKDNIQPILYFIILSLLINFPIIYTINISEIFVPIYAILSYFITVIALSISYYYIFKEDWKYKINAKLIVWYIFVQFIFITIIFNHVNFLLNVNYINIIDYTLPAMVFSLFLLFIDNMNENFMITRWIFRSFIGKGFTFEKEITDINEFKTLINLFSRKSLIRKIDDTVIIFEDFSGNVPTYFLTHNKEKNIIRLQISKNKGFSFDIDESFENFKTLLISLNFKYIGKETIDNSLFTSNFDYPKFAKAKIFCVIWIFLGIIIFIISSEIFFNVDTTTYNNIKLIVLNVFTPINAFVEKNQGLALIVAMFFGAFFSNLEKIKSFCQKIIENIKNM